jgi:hypothetical protein
VDKETSMSKANQDSGDHQGETTIDRHYIESIKTYEISEDQLMIVESGSSGGTALNFCIALYSIDISFIVSLLTTTIGNVAILSFFWVIISVTSILGTFFLITWLKSRKSSKSIFEKIRKQKSTRVIRDNALADEPVTDTSDEQSENDN